MALLVIPGTIKGSFLDRTIDQVSHMIVSLPQIYMHFLRSWAATKKWPAFFIRTNSSQGKDDLVLSRQHGIQDEISRAFQVFGRVFRDATLGIDASHQDLVETSQNHIW